MHALACSRCDACCGPGQSALLQWVDVRQERITIARLHLEALICLRGGHPLDSSAGGNLLLLARGTDAAGFYLKHDRR